MFVLAASADGTAALEPASAAPPSAEPDDAYARLQRMREDVPTGYDAAAALANGSADFTVATTAQIEAISTSVIGSIETRDLVSLSTVQVKGFTTAQIHAFSDSQVSALLSSQIASLST